MSSRSRAVFLALSVLLVTAGSVAGQVATPVTATSGEPVTELDRQETGLEAQSETFRIRLRPDGTARWIVTANVSIDDESDRAAFEELGTAFEQGRTEPLGLDAFREASRAASTATGREMSITSVNRSYRVGNDTGQLVLRFTWSNFSRQSGAILHVDDAFNTTSGTWLPAIGDDQTLMIEPPPGYAITGATPPGYEVSNAALIWDGPRTFRPGDLTATYRRVQQTETPTPTPTPTPNSTGPNGTEQSLLLAGFLVIGLFLAALGAYVFRDRDLGIPSPTTAGSGDATDGGETTSTASAGNNPTSEQDLNPDGAAATGAEIDEELLSDEERVERLLEQNGGRMKQANIVTETGWSNAKVSQLLSSMEGEGRIDKLRIGRENLISFPDEDVTDLDSEDG
jgi:hypothetical protein